MVMGELAQGAMPWSAPGPAGTLNGGAPLRRLLWPLGTSTSGLSSNQEGSTEWREGWGLGPADLGSPIEECLVIPKDRRLGGKGEPL